MVGKLRKKELITAENSLHRTGLKEFWSPVPLVLGYHWLGQPHPPFPILYIVCNRDT